MISRRLIEKAENLLAKEKGTVYKDPGGKVNVCLVYPNTYHVGMSSLAIQGIYGLLNDRSDTVCERAFLPDDEDLREIYRTGSELFSLESKRPLRDFDIIAFSVSFENDYPSVPLILRLANLEPLASKRSVHDPLLLLGGVCATFNPEPLAPFFDVVFIGEADTALHEFIETFKSSEVRDTLLRELARKEGFYIPSFYEVGYSKDGTISNRKPISDAPLIIKKRTERDLKNTVRPSIFTPETEFSDMALVEAMRGCPWSCRFCLAGHIYNPPRQKNLEDIKEEIALLRTMTDRVGLIGPSLSDYRHIEAILSETEADFSITSLRANKRALKLLKLMKGKRSVSIAPEAGTERLRRIINKKITEEDILTVSEGIFKEGISILRLYFMIGLPFERDEDIEGIISLAKKIRALNQKGTVVLSISTFVPKPFTPFQWHPMAPMETVKKRLKHIKRSLKIRGIRILHDVVKYAYLQGLFAMGDRRLTAPLLKMENPGNWKKVLKDARIDPGFYLFREREYSEILPWDFIDINYPKERLWKEYEEAKRYGL